MASLITLITESYNQKLVDQLVQKFQSEEKNLTPQIITAYIQRFDQIKSSPNVQQKDITKYSWKDLETVVDANQKKKVKAGKVDATAEDANLIYRDQRFRVYVGKDQKACIKYGNGYSFCISARGEDSMYQHYRFDGGGTPYFVFDDSKTTETKDNEFVDPEHLLVVFVLNDPYGEQTYQVTTANNDGDRSFNTTKELANAFPQLSSLVNLFKSVDLSRGEYLEKTLGDLLKRTVKEKFGQIDYEDFYMSLRGREESVFYRMIANLTFGYGSSATMLLDFVKSVGAKKRTIRLEYMLFDHETGEPLDKQSHNIICELDKSDLKAKIKNVVNLLADDNHNSAQKIIDSMEIFDMTHVFEKANKEVPGLQKAVDSVLADAAANEKDLNRFKMINDK